MYQKCCSSSSKSALSVPTVLFQASAHRNTAAAHPKRELPLQKAQVLLNVEQFES